MHVLKFGKDIQENGKGHWESGQGWTEEVPLTLYSSVRFEIFRHNLLLLLKRLKMSFKNIFNRVDSTSFFHKVSGCL